MYQTSNLPNTRLHVADALRGIALIGIILIHNVDHMDFFVRLPPATNEWVAWLNRITRDGLYFAFSGKMYSIFALMFGFSFFIQNDNQVKQGKNFSLRFIWRMTLLVVFGVLNTFFYCGDILVSYAIFGMLMPLASKLNTKTLAMLCCFLLVQPLEIYQAISALFDSNYQLINASSGEYYRLMAVTQEHGTLWEAGYNSLRYGQLATFKWNISSGRITQIPGLFLLGMLLGRLRLFYNEKNNLNTWLGILAITLVVFFPLYGLSNLLSDYISRRELLVPVRGLLRAWTNLAQTISYVSLLVLLFYSSATINRMMTKLTCLGRASMSNYLIHSMIGATLYYGWGFGLLRCNQVITVFIAIGIILLQYYLSYWWFKTHSHGPMEGLWKKLTWINK